MEKSFLVAGALVAGVIAACTGSGGSSNFGEPADAGGEPPPISPIVPDPSAPDGSAQAQCSPKIPDPFKASWVAPTKQAECGADDVKEYYEACLADLTQRDKCATWTAAHPECTACLEPANKSGPIQWYDAAIKPRLFYTINVAGCLAIQQNKLAETDCGGTYNAAIQCGRQSCMGCLETGGAFQDFRACQQAVQSQGICKSYESQMSTTCRGYRAAGAPTLQCFQETGETQSAFFQRVEKIFCGQ